MSFKKYTNEILIDILKSTYEKTGRIPVAHKVKLPSAKTYREYFGSWDKAINEAFPNKNIKLNKNDIRKLLQDKKGELKRNPTIKDIDNKMYSRIKILYSTFDEALLDAGLPSNVSKIYSREELIQSLKDKYEETGIIPKALELKYPFISYRQYYKIYNTWDEALKDAGFDLEKRKEKRKLESSNKIIKYSDEDLIRLLKQKFIELGHTPSLTEMKKPSRNIYCKRFGSWEKALNILDLKVNKPKIYSKEELISILQNIRDTTGKTPNYYNMKKPCGATFTNKFGSWEKALKEAGVVEKSERNKPYVNKTIGTKKCLCCSDKSVGIVYRDDKIIGGFCEVCKKYGFIDKENKYTYEYYK